MRAFLPFSFSGSLKLWEGAREQRGPRCRKPKRGWGAVKEATEMGKEGRRYLLRVWSMLDSVLSTYACSSHSILLVAHFTDQETERIREIEWRAQDNRAKTSGAQL